MLALCPPYYTRLDCSVYQVHRGLIDPTYDCKWSLTRWNHRWLLSHYIKFCSGALLTKTC